MAEGTLVKLFEHNNWANQQVIQACSVLSDEQLDARPAPATKGSIRRTLIHLVASQQGYLSLLTLPVDERTRKLPTYEELQKWSRGSGEGLLSLARDGSLNIPGAKLKTMDGYTVEPWVVMVQAINHATEHREQIKSMLSALGVTPPGISGWDYGEVTGGLIQVS